MGGRMGSLEEASFQFSVSKSELKLQRSGGETSRVGGGGRATEGPAPHGGWMEGAGRSGGVEEIRQTWTGGATDLALNRRLNLPEANGGAETRV